MYEDRCTLYKLFSERIKFVKNQRKNHFSSKKNAFSGKLKYKKQ
jgi:hypothetical protein